MVGLCAPDRLYGQKFDFLGDDRHGTTILIGRLLDGQGNSLSGLRLKIMVEGIKAVATDTTWFVQRTYSSETDGAGRYRARVVSRGAARARIEVMMVGDQLGTWLVPLEPGETRTVALDIKLRPEPVVLPEVSVEGRRFRGRDEFNRRMVSGQGQFINRAQIVLRNPSTTVDLLRGFRGFDITCRGNQPCVPRSLRGPMGCTSLIIMDGIEIEHQLLSSIQPSELEGIEAYRGISDAPLEFGRNPEDIRCGMFLLWTRFGDGH